MIGQSCGFQLSDRGDFGRRSRQEHFIGNEELGFIDRAFHHIDAHALCELDHAGSGDAFEDVLVNTGCDQLTIANDEQIHAAGFGHLAPGVHQQGLIKSTLDSLCFGQRAGDVGTADFAP